MILSQSILNFQLCHKYPLKEESTSLSPKQETARSELLEDVNVAVPFNQDTCSLIDSISTDDNKDGTYFDIVQKSEAGIDDIAFKVCGTVRYPGDFVLTPRSAILSRYDGSAPKTDKYRLRVALDTDEAEAVGEGVALLLEKFQNAGCPKDIAISKGMRE